MQQQREIIAISVNTHYVFFSTIYKRDIHKRNLSLKDPQEKKIQLINKLWDLDKKVPIGKNSILNNVAAREKVLINFKSETFQIINLVMISAPQQVLQPAPKLTPDPTPSPTVFDSPKQQQNELRNSHLNCIKLKMMKKYKHNIQGYLRNI